MTNRIATEDTAIYQGWPRRLGRGLVLALTSLLLMSVALLTPAALDAQATGTITGQVVNGTQGGGSVDGLEVQLHMLAHDTGEPTGPPATTRVDAQGTFSFGGIATAGKNGYVATVAFQGVTYSSDMTVFQSGESTKAIEVKVYEPTGSAEAVTVRQHHLVVDVDAEKRVLKLLDISIVVNRGDTAFVGKQAGAGNETVRLLLPAGAREIQLDGELEENAAPIAGGLTYQAPLLPGEKALVVTYLLDYTGPTLTLTKTLSLPTDSVDLLIADRGVKVAGAQFTPQQSVQLNGQQYLRLTRKGVAPDSLIALQFSDLPGVGLALNVGQWPIAAGLAILVGGGTYLVATRRRRIASWRPARRRAATPDEPDEPDEPDGPDGPDGPDQSADAARRPVASQPARVRAVVADEPDDEDLLEP